MCARSSASVRLVHARGCFGEGSDGGCDGRAGVVCQGTFGHGELVCARAGTTIDLGGSGCLEETA